MQPQQPLSSAFDSLNEVNLLEAPTDLTPGNTPAAGNTRGPVTPVTPVTPETVTPVVPVTQPPVTPVVPVTQPPVTPVNAGNTDSLPLSEGEGNTEELVSTTFKLPASVLRSMEESVRELNEVTPGNTRHKYGVDLLTKHKELTAALFEVAYCRSLFDHQESVITELRSELEAEKRRTNDLTHQLRDATSYINRTEHHPGSAVTPPVTPQISEPAPMAVQADNQLQHEYALLLSRYDQAVTTAKSLEVQNQQLNQFLRGPVANGLASVYNEASRNSWFTAEYYQQIFTVSARQ